MVVAVGSNMRFPLMGIMAFGNPKEDPSLISTCQVELAVKFNGWVDFAKTELKPKRSLPPVVVFLLR